MEMMRREWEEVRVCCVVGVFDVDWSRRRRIVEVYKGFLGRVHWGPYRCAVFLLKRLDNSCRGAWECVV